MGVRGLTSFIAGDSERYLKPIALRDSDLVLDGNCVASHLYKWCTKRDSAFGGDYDEYYDIVRGFFVLLKKCKIRPIVFFDGGYEEKKLRTVKTRLKNKLMTLKTTFSREFSTAKFFPIFMRDVFCEALTSLNVPVVQCEYEADGEIAALGRNLQCPVLSYDSDFFIYDVLYIPFSTVQLESSLAANEDGSLPGLLCSIYNVNEFLKEYPGLRMNHLPLLATLLGNDFVHNHNFQKFFLHMPLSKSRAISNGEKRIQGLLKWMSSESETSAIQKVKARIGLANFDKFITAVDVTKSNYDVSCQCLIEKKGEGITIHPPPFNLPLDKKTVKMIMRCELPPFIINLIVLRMYFLPLQIEDINQNSSHIAALPLIEAIDQIVCRQSGIKTDLTLFIREKRILKGQVLTNRQATFEGKDRKLILLEVMKLDSRDRYCINTFSAEMQLFFICFIFWCKNANPSVYHVHALLIGFLANQVKNRMGYFRPQSDFSSEDLIKLTSVFRPFRKTSESARFNYDIKTVHSFNIFQSVLYHCSVLNTLIGKPLPSCRVKDVFSGTLLYNVFSAIENRGDVMKALHSFLDPVEKFQKLYAKLYEKLLRFFPPVPTIRVVEKKRRRRKKGKTKIAPQELEPEEEESKSTDYCDAYNKFSVLSA